MPVLLATSSGVMGKHAKAHQNRTRGVEEVEGLHRPTVQRPDIGCQRFMGLGHIRRWVAKSSEEVEVDWSQ